MRILKKILLVLAILIAVPLIVALFVKKEYSAEREVTINRPKTEVFEYIKHLKNQEQYSKWANLDPNMKTTYTGTDGTPGFISRWESDSDSVGVGEQEIKKITGGERIDFELRFEKPFESTEQAYMITESVDNNQTKVKWGFNGKMKYPFNLICLFMNIEQMISNDLQTGLDKLKLILESQAPVPDGSIAFLSDYYNQTTRNLTDAVKGLSQAQLTFVSGPGKWSIAQCLEHIIATEKMLFEMAKTEIAKPAQPTRRSEVKTTDEALVSMVTDRSEKFNAPKELQPSGKYVNANLALNDFNATRQPVLDYISSADLGNLRNHIIEHPTGISDGYQNLLFIAAHSARHTKQIEEVKSQPNFPNQ
ncbi:DinB family protein [Sphingobacterium sp. JB170]|uniref:DinB family protein n=1 Tax=Sphingobacterium sp. JB170 TaxID=1434842 RepID=UPI00097F0DFD|nr:DinB family protein [Sphingobacterium sp. JB170]SJN46035.1 hypothetical protein FM107_14100 [Sphingobacterium sp. JB170]